MSQKMYVIVSLKHSEKNEVCFWRPDNVGYTTNPWAAGLYTEEQVSNDPSYYNNGNTTVAVCINNSSLPESGLTISITDSLIQKYRRNNKGDIHP